jgi:hypothetical protein
MSIPARTRKLLRERAHGCCEACGKPGATNGHHRINQSQGGPDTLSNLMLLCGSGTTGCHGIVTVNPADARTLGYTVTLADIPLNQREPICAATAPVYRWSRELGCAEWVLLDDDGGITPSLESI